MDFSTNKQNSSRRLTGFGSVVAFHVVLVYALVSGLGPRVSLFPPRPPEPIEVLPMNETPRDPPPVTEHQVKQLKPAFVSPTELFRDQPMDLSIQDITFQPPDTSVIEVAENKYVEKTVRREAPVVDARACEKPEYPAHAVREGYQGMTVLQFLIGVDGKVLDSKVSQSSGYRELDRAALSGLGRCSFKAGTVDGKPEPSWTSIQYVWKLD